MRKILNNDQTTGDVFHGVPPQFAIVIINPAGNTFPDNTYLEYAVSVVEGEPVAASDMVWNKRHPSPFGADAGVGQNGNTVKFFNHISGVAYRMVTDTAGIEAVIGTVL